MAVVRERQDDEAARDAGQWAGPRWLWFGVLGGGLAWTVHLLAAWLADELGCARGPSHVFGMPLSLATGLATVVPGAVALVALGVAWRALRTLRRAEAEPPSGVSPRRIGRARFMAEVGLWIDLLSLLMITFGGAAVVTFSPCVR